MHKQISGEWTFHLQDYALKQNEELYQHTCGHTLPSREEQAYLAFANRTTEREFGHRVTVSLEQNNSFMFDYQEQRFRGVWTMIYDEGFEMKSKTSNGEDVSFFAFSKYGLNSDRNNSERRGMSSKWLSYCSQTLVGWYRFANYWGCYYGVKNVENANEAVNQEVSGKQIVVANSIKPVEMNFLQTSFHLLIQSDFKNHQLIVNHLNRKNLGWTAATYPEFEGKSVAELNKMAGRIHSKGVERSLEANRLFRFREVYLDDLPLFFFNKKLYLD